MEAELSTVLCPVDRIRASKGEGRDQVAQRDVDGVHNVESGIDAGRKSGFDRDSKERFERTTGQIRIALRLATQVSGHRLAYQATRAQSNQLLDQRVSDAIQLQVNGDHVQ